MAAAAPAVPLTAAIYVVAFVAILVLSVILLYLMVKLEGRVKSAPVVGGALKGAVSWVTDKIVDGADTIFEVMTLKKVRDVGSHAVRSLRQGRSIRYVITHETGRVWKKIEPIFRVRLKTLVSWALKALLDAIAGALTRLWSTVLGQAKRIGQVATDAKLARITARMANARITTISRDLIYGRVIPRIGKAEARIAAIAGTTVALGRAITGVRAGIRSLEHQAARSKNRLDLLGRALPKALLAGGMVAYLVTQVDDFTRGFLDGFGNQIDKSMPVPKHWQQEEKRRDKL